MHSYLHLFLKLITLFVDIRRPPSQSVLSPMLFNTGLTHLDSETSIKFELLINLTFSIYLILYIHGKYSY